MEPPMKVAVVIKEDNSMEGDMYNMDAQRKKPSLETGRTEGVGQIWYGESLKEHQKQQAREIFNRKEANLTNIPLKTNFTTCTILLSNDKPVFVCTRSILTH